MNFYRRFGRTKWSPRKHRQAKIYSGGVQCIDSIGQIDSETLVGIQPSCLRNQPLGEVRVNSPIAGFVGIGQCRAGNWFFDSHMVKLGCLSRQACFYIPKTFSIGQLSKGHYSKLLCATQRTNPIVAAVAIYNAIKRAPWKKIHYLCEQGLASIHRYLRESWFPKDYRYADLNSSRHHKNNVEKDSYSCCYILLASF